MEAGNSSKVIRQHYWELTKEEEGKEYFEIGLEGTK